VLMPFADQVLNVSLWCSYKYNWCLCRCMFYTKCKTGHVLFLFFSTSK